MRLRAANAARQPSSHESGRRQPAKEAPRQTTAVVENDARRGCLAIWKHSGLIAHTAPKRDMRLPPPSFRNGALAPGPESRDSGFDAEPVIGPRFARTRWHRPGMTVTGLLRRKLLLAMAAAAAKKRG